MKKILFIFISFILIGALHSQWEHLTGPQGANIQSFGFKNQSVIYAGSYGTGFFRSNDGGQSWKQTNAGLTENGKYIYSILYLNINIYAGTAEGVFRSSDNGNTWQNFNAGISDYTVNSLANSGTKIYAGTTNGLYYSTNSGVTWNATALTDAVYCLYIDGSVIYAGTYSSNFLVKSGDGGVSWTACSNGLISYVYRLTKFKNKLYAGTAWGVYTSTDNGVSWNIFNTGVTGADAYVKDFGNNGTNLYAIFYGAGVFRLSGAGTEWIKVLSQIPYSLNTGLSALCCDNNIVLAGLTAGIYRSEDKGADWAEANQGLTGDLTPVMFSVTNSKMYLIGEFTNNGDDWLYSSDDEGSSWSNISMNLNNHAINSLDASGQKVYLGAAGAILYSSNSARSWVQVDTPLFKYNNVITISKTNNNIIYHLQTWHHHGKDLRGLSKSTDNGYTWWEIDSTIDIFNAPFVTLTDKNNFIYLGTAEKFYRSSDGGTSFTLLSDAFGVNSISISGNNVYASKYGGGVIKSKNNGNTWQSINTGLADSVVNCLSAIYGDYVYAGTGSGIYWTTDGGSHWKKLNGGLGVNKNVLAIIQNDSYVYCNIEGAGLYRHEQVMDAPVAINPQGNNIPEVYSLKQNYPNPFNPVTKIGFDLPKDGNVKLVVYDLLGREVSLLVNTFKKAGTYSFDFDGNKLSSGVYFYKLETPEFTDIKRMVLVK